MTSRRSFFSRLFKAGAIAAIAPKFGASVSRRTAGMACKVSGSSPCTLTHATIHQFTLKDFHDMSRIEEGRNLA